MQHETHHDVPGRETTNGEGEAPEVDGTAVFRQYKAGEILLIQKE